MVEEEADTNSRITLRRDRIIIKSPWAEEGPLRIVGGEGELPI